MKAVCPLCRARRGKRQCPARGEWICAACCGAKRRVEIHCPEDCAYLTGAHASAWAGRETEHRRDLRRFAHRIDQFEDQQLRLFFVTLAGIDALRDRHAGIDDRLLAGAVAALRRTIETRAKGVLYEHAPDDPRAALLLRDLRGVFESSTQSGQPVAPHDRDLLAVLTAVDGALQDVLRERSAPTAFLDSVGRLAARLGAASPAPRGPALIVQP